jgi:hypothetical protein
VEVRVHDITDGIPLLVRFSCLVGTATAVWMGDPPTRGEKYQVECDVPGAATWGANFAASEETGALIEEKADGVFLRGRVEPGMTEGVVALTIGDGMVLVEVHGEHPDLTGTWVRLQVPRLALYPYVA